MTSDGRQGAHRVECLSVCLSVFMEASAGASDSFLPSSTPLTHTDTLHALRSLSHSQLTPHPLHSFHSIPSSLPPSLRSVELRTWGGRDVNITSKNVRNLLEAVVLKGIVKNIKVRTSYLDDSLLPFLRVSSLLSPSSSHPSSSRVWACLILSQPPPWPRRLASRV